jgi:SulP family sulfate permease
MPENIGTSFSYLLQPVRFLRSYQRRNLRSDLIAGLTVAVVLLPQAIAYALIADLPPQVGLYTAIIGAIVAALWGSSNHLQTGPTNAISLLVLSSLITTSTTNAIESLILVGVMAVMVGVFQLVMGLVRLGVLVNFVSHSVVVGFSAGAGILIAVKQLPHLFGLSYPSHGMLETMHGFINHLPDTHPPSVILGFFTILLILVLRRIQPKLPGPLIGMALASAAVGFLGLAQQGVIVIGDIPRGLPPLTRFQLFNPGLIGELATGALAIAAIGLVEAISIARSIASQSGQRLDSNQELVGQGLSNIAAGIFSGYPGSGSFTRSAVNYDSGARTPMASLSSGFIVLIAMIAFAPLMAYIPRTALAGVLILTAIGMINRKEISRIWRGARDDAIIMVVTFLGTLFLHLEFAVLVGILLSFAVYIIRTSVPQVVPVLPDKSFRHFSHQLDAPPCPQLAIKDILGDMYFGAVSHIDKVVRQHLDNNPGQRFLLLRMHSVNHCDYSGIHALQEVVEAYREYGGDVFMVRVHEPVYDLMKTTGFCEFLGEDHFLSEDKAIFHIFQKILDPAVCIYECEIRAFYECQNLPKRIIPLDQLPRIKGVSAEEIEEIIAKDLWNALHGIEPHHIIDVREPREFYRGHIPQAKLHPLPMLLSEKLDLSNDHEVILVCRSGRRSRLAAGWLISQGYKNVKILQGGMLAWESAGLFEAIEDIH